MLSSSSVRHLQQALEGLICKVAECCVREHLQHVGQNARVEALNPFFSCQRSDCC